MQTRRTCHLRIAACTAGQESGAQRGDTERRLPQRG